jgi:hypothetical protein
MAGGALLQHHQRRRCPQGGQYQLDGTDDQCGAAQAASVRGMAFQNPNGTIGFGLTIVTAPGGIPLHIDATITLPGLNGTWRDSGGNTGNFIFGGGVPHVGPRPVPSGGLAPHSVTTIQIAPAAVTNAQLAADAVTGANVVDASLTTADILGAPVGAFASGDQALTLTSTPVAVRSLTISIPTSGRVIVNASANARFADTSTTVEYARCSIGTSATTLDSAHTMIVGDSGVTLAFMYLPIAATRGFNVSAGSFTVHLVCDEFSGDIQVWDSSLTAVYSGQ